MSKVTVKQAASLTGKSRETINTATNDGLLSYSLNSRKHKVVDVAELARVFSLVKTMDQIKQDSDRVSNGQRPSVSDTTTEFELLREKLTNSEQLREMLTSERERERRQLESEIETLRHSLETSQQQHSKAMLLITDQSQNTNNRHTQWEKAVTELETKIANQQTAFEKRVGELKQEGFSKAKSLPWYQLLFKNSPDVL